MVCCLTEGFGFLQYTSPGIKSAMESVKEMQTKEFNYAN